MYRIQWLLLVIVLFMAGCHLIQEDPAKSQPKFEIKVEKFDSAFFAMDTLAMTNSVGKLMANYPNFAPDFFSNILMLDAKKDTVSIKAFYKAYWPIYKETLKVNAISNAQVNFEAAFARLHYYFPQYPLPHQLILFIGPLESYGNIVTKDAIALGMQMYLGGDSEWYYAERIQTIYPTYLSRRFAPAYMIVNSVQNIINDIEPPIQGNTTLINEMIAAGKKQFIINRCLPNLPDTLLFGYTNEQYKGVVQEESKIWEYVLHNKLSYSTNPSDIRSFMQEGVYNDIFGEAIPGDVGKYLGYKIVQAWMRQNAQKGISMKTLLSTPPEQIFTNAGYTP